MIAQDPEQCASDSRATCEQSRGLQAAVGLGWIFPVSLLLIAGAELYMTLTVWTLRTAWVDVALTSFVLIVPIGQFGIRPRLHASMRAATEAADGPVSPSLWALTHSVAQGTTMQTLAAFALSTIFLMTNKPDLVGSLIAVGVSLVLGLLSGVPQRRAAATTSVSEAVA